MSPKRCSYQGVIDKIIKGVTAAILLVSHSTLGRSIYGKRCDERNVQSRPFDSRLGTDVGLHSEPGFVSNLRNVTVPEGRDVTLSCTVKNLGEHKVPTL